MLTSRYVKAESVMSTSKQTAPQPPLTEEQRLDEALDETFPASDPIAVRPDVPSTPPAKRKGAAAGNPAGGRKH
jgi:hypothetical protein